MGSILNGLRCTAVCGHSAATFLVFSDYMRPPIAWPR